MSKDAALNDSADDDKKLDFLRQIVADDIEAGRVDQVRTRFPPEPNGYLHVGHCKSLHINFGIAREFGGTCNLRYDDTNPAKEDTEYVDAILDDIRWVGFEPDAIHFASDYFDQLYEWAEKLVLDGLAYVDTQDLDAIRAQRGTASEPGSNSPYRDREPEENLELLRKMKDGGFGDGEAVLRAKIDMASKHLIMRDPLMYRVRHEHHHRTGDTWCIYPMYDYAHGQCDAIEKITHSLCSLEFETHKPLYNWFIEKLGLFPSKQYEFSRLFLAHTLMSKRKLLELVESGVVDGWDDPRMPTIRGLRNRGYTPEAIATFCQDIGVTRFNGLTSYNVFENALRADLNKRAERRMAVVNPLKVTITNWPASQVEEMEAVNNPENDADGTRLVPFSGTLFIEREDFLEDPPKKFFRLGPGREVRLRWAYFITCTDFVKDGSGEVVELLCTYDPETKGGDAPDGRKVKGTLHWVSADHAVPATVIEYEPLLTPEDPSDMPEGDAWRDAISENSRAINTSAFLEPSLAEYPVGQPVQFERNAYFVRADAETLTYKRSVTLREASGKKR